MSRILQYLFAGILLSITATAGAADLRVASWNIQNLGWGQQKSYKALGAIGRNFDFIAVQEVMSEEGLARLKQALEIETKVSWQHSASHLIGRGSYKEMYAFLWRPDRVEHLGGDVVYLDKGDRFAREPFSARFRARAGGEPFVVATVHILYGKSVEHREPEIRELTRYWAWLEEVYPEERSRILLMGDFNLAPSHPAWASLKLKARPLITAGATTLSSRDGRYANLYDNIWVSLNTSLEISEAGVFRYPQLLGWSHEKARRHVSDHAPVMVSLAVPASMPLRSQQPQKMPARVPATATASCIDLNSASPTELEKLAHIGPARAAAIIAGRPWARVDELTRIRGLGQARVADIKSQGLVCQAN